MRLFGVVPERGGFQARGSGFLWGRARKGLLFATFFSLFFRKVISLPYSFSGFFLGRPLLVSFFSIVCLFSIL